MVQSVRRRPGLRAPIGRAPVRRSRVWARHNQIVSPVAAGNATDILNSYFTAYGTTNAPPGVTIGGVMLDYGVVQTSTRVSSTDGLNIGLIVTNEDVPAQVPTPAVDIHADWMWWQWLPAPGSASGASSSTFNSLGGPLRLKSRRRMQELGQRLWLVWQADGTTTYDVRFRTSTLLLMP